MLGGLAFFLSIVQLCASPWRRGLPFPLASWVFSILSTVASLGIIIGWYCICCAPNLPPLAATCQFDTQIAFFVWSTYTRHPSITQISKLGAGAILFQPATRLCMFCQSCCCVGCVPVLGHLLFAQDTAPWHPRHRSEHVAPCSSCCSSVSNDLFQRTLPATRCCHSSPLHQVALLHDATCLYNA